MKHTEEYEKINKVLTRLEEGKFATHDINWCADRIDWAWKWRKIEKNEMKELADRCIVIFNQELGRFEREDNEK